MVRASSRRGLCEPGTVTTSPTVVLVHGIRASSSMWRAQRAALDRAGVAHVAPDLPGHGARRAERFSIAGAVAAIDEAARTAAGPVVVAGLSLGGYLALHWAARATPRPAAVLAASCCTEPRGPALRAYRRVAATIARLPDGGAAFNDALARRFLPAEALRDVQAGGMTVGVMQDALGDIETVRPLEDLAALDGVPVWLLNGTWDHFRVHERRFLRARPDARLIHVPRATHLVSLVAPVAFNRALLELVDEVAAGAVRRVWPPAEVRAPAAPTPAPLR